MKKELTFSEKLIVNAWSLIVFFGVFMFSIQFTIEMCSLLNVKSTFTLQILSLAGCVYLYAKNDDIKHYDMIEVKGFEKRLIYHYRCATKEEKTAVKDILNLSCFDDEEEN